MSNIASVLCVALIGVLVIVPAWGTLRKHDPWAFYLGAALAVLFSAGHLIDRERVTYPFVSWRMYTSAQPPRAYFQFQVTTTSQTYDYPFHAITPWSPGPLSGYSMLAPLTQRLVALVNRCQCHEDDSELDRIIVGLVEAHEQRTAAVVDRFEILTALAKLDGQQATSRTLYTWSKDRTP